MVSLYQMTDQEQHRNLLKWIHVWPSVVLRKHFPTFTDARCSKAWCASCTGIGPDTFKETVRRKSRLYG